MHPELEQTRRDDEALRHLLYLEQITREKAQLQEQNPDYFQETTVPVLNQSDIIEPTTIIREVTPELLRAIEDQNRLQFTVVEESGPISGDDITFLHPHDVIPLKGEGTILEQAPKGGQKNRSLEPAELHNGESTDLPPFVSLAQPTLAVEEMHSAISQSAEELYHKDYLVGADAYRLLELVLKDPEDKALKAFILKIAPTRLDYDVFWANQELLSAQFIQSVLSVGSHQEIDLDAESGQQKITMIYSGLTLHKSNIGHVFYAWQAHSDNLKLRRVLIKTPLEMALEMIAHESRQAFEDEMEISRQFRKMAHKKSNHPYLRHLLLPDHRGVGFLSLPMIKNELGESRDLNQIIWDEKSPVREWSKCLAGAVKGTTLALEEGYIDVDFKPTNIMEGEEGGVVIDLGGFLERAAFERGEIEIRTNSIKGNLYPLINNGLRHLKTDEMWDLSNGNVQRTPNYTSLHLLAQELNGQMPAGSCHKFSIYRMLESYFEHRDLAKRDLGEYMMLDEISKLNQPPLSLKVSDLEPAEQLLFDLYLKLHQSHRHPWRFRDNNPSHGIDPEYIGMGEIIARLEEIAIYPID